VLRLVALLAACNPKVPAPPPVAPPATLVSLQSSAVSSSDKEVVLRVLASTEVRPCFEALLLRSPTAYGDVAVQFTIGSDGTVTEARPQFATLGDAEAEACVAASVQALRFPNRDMPITVLYPFVLITERTPAEVGRALRDRYGLLPENEKDPGSGPNDPPPPGVVVVW
jgi:hypothetical protein